MSTANQISFLHFSVAVMHYSLVTSLGGGAICDWAMKAQQRSLLLGAYCLSISLHAAHLIPSTAPPSLVLPLLL